MQRRFIYLQFKRSELAYKFAEATWEEMASFQLNGSQSIKAVAAHSRSDALKYIDENLISGKIQDFIFVDKHRHVERLFPK